MKKVISLVILSCALVAFQNCARLESANYSSETDVVDNAALGRSIYKAECAQCHNSLEKSAKAGKPPKQIIWALKNVPEMTYIKLSELEIRAVSEALKVDDSICEIQDLPGHTPASRISHTEYERSVNYLFGTNTKWTSGFSSDNSAGLFDNEIFSKNTNPQLIKSYFETSKTIVDSVFADANTRAKLMICNASGGSTCASSIVNKIARLAFKRALTNEDKTILLAPYLTGVSLGFNFNDSLKAALRAVLINPEFIFKIYKTSTLPVRDLDSYELASRLSYFIWGSLPDDSLLAKAESNEILKTAVLDQEVRRLLDDSKSEYIIESFGRQWLGLDKIHESSKQPDPALFPNFTPQLKQDLITETMTFVRNFVREDKSPLDLVLADYTYLNQRLSSHYGFTFNLGQNFTKVTLPPQRSGVLTHGSILTMTSNPDETSIVNRGSWALKRLLCSEPPPDAPPGVSTEIPNIEGLSLRERLQVHRDKPACASCHSVMDPLGFSFENFGPTGVARTRWSDGFNIDATGSLPDGSSFDGVHELALRITENQEFQKCFSEHLMTFAVGRQISANDRCTVNRIGKRDISSTSKFSDLVRSIVYSDPFKRYQNEEVE